MDDWKTFAFPCWVSARFQVRLLLVLGTVSVWFYFLELPLSKTPAVELHYFGVFWVMIPSFGIPPPPVFVWFLRSLGWVFQVLSFAKILPS